MFFKAWMEDFAEKHVKNVLISGMGPNGHDWFALKQVNKMIWSRGFANLSLLFVPRPKVRGMEIIMK